ncbi:MAG: HAMP domain-containing protein [Gammaproteobacteria bacterium]|nr:HAMP domain-containing protein [Gammaproteobacteria bacterium]
MALNIKYKLFLVITIACTVVVIGMFIVMQWSFDRGFLKYVNKTELSMFDTFHSAVTEEFLEYGDWDFVLDDPRQWHELIREALPEGRPLSLRMKRRKGPGNRRRRPPPEHLFNEGDERGPPPDEFRELPLNLRGLVRRFTLFDENKKPMLGPPVDFNQQTTKALVFNETIVGYLGLIPRKELSNQNQLQFSRQQADTFAWIAIGSLLIAGALAFPLANHFVKPIKMLKQSTQSLTSGEYKTRNPHKSNDELGKLSRDFNVLAKTLEDNEVARKRWIADISHELRTPLAILRGEIEAIIDKVREPDPKSMESLHQEVLQLTRLVNDLYELSVSDLGALNYRMTNVDITKEIANTLSSFESNFDTKNIKVTTLYPSDKKCLIRGDCDRLHQLFTNLLENSLRYTNDNGTLEIAILEQGNHLTLTFSDSAPAVATSDLPKLFDRLYRADPSRNRSLGGAGLGLAIANNIVDAHQGEMDAMHSDLGGLMIAIKLPLLKN